MLSPHTHSHQHHNLFLPQLLGAHILPVPFLHPLLSPQHLLTVLFLALTHLWVQRSPLRPKSPLLHSPPDRSSKQHSCTLWGG